MALHEWLLLSYAAGREAGGEKTVDAAVGSRVAGGHDGGGGSVIVECRLQEGLACAAGAVYIFPGGCRGVGELVGADADYGAVALV